MVLIYILTFKLYKILLAKFCLYSKILKIKIFQIPIKKIQNKKINYISMKTKLLIIYSK